MQVAFLGVWPRRSPLRSRNARNHPARPPGIDGGSGGNGLLLAYEFAWLQSRPVRSLALSSSSGPSVPSAAARGFLVYRKGAPLRPNGAVTSGGRFERTRGEREQPCLERKEARQAASFLLTNWRGRRHRAPEREGVLYKVAVADTSRIAASLPLAAAIHAAVADAGGVRRR